MAIAGKLKIKSMLAKRKLGLTQLQELSCVALCNRSKAMNKKGG
jgi:hypothetical protein